MDAMPKHCVLIAATNHPELLDRAVKGDAPIYHADSTANDSEESANEEESLGRKFYKDLMNGVSHMLPFVVGGGILIAIAFLLDDYSINPANFGKILLWQHFSKQLVSKHLDLCCLY